MKRTNRNSPIRLKVEGVIVGYDHIASYMNLKHKVIKVNQQLADKLAARVGYKMLGVVLG